jgi:serine/threonine-protein kinase
MYALEHYEEIDDIYRRKQQKKLGSFIATSVLAVLFGLTSVWGYFSAEQKKGENYDLILAKAQEVAEIERKDAIYSKVDDRHFSVTANVEICDLFYGWLLGFGKRVKLVYPEDAVEGFKAYLDKVRGMYE